MNQIKEDLLLHPVRLRIILAAAGRQVTTQQLADELTDIPQASLYRNINMLAEAGILQVVKERRVHNTIEKTYAIHDQMQTLLSVQDLENAQAEDFIRIFTQYLGMQLGYFVRYVQRGDVDLVRDHATFRMFPLYLNEDEVGKLGQALNDLLLPLTKNGPSEDRQRYIFGLESFPDFTGPQAPGQSKNQTEVGEIGQTHGE